MTDVIKECANRVDVKKQPDYRTVATTGRDKLRVTLLCHTIDIIVPSEVSVETALSASCYRTQCSLMCSSLFTPMSAEIQVGSLTHETVEAGKSRS